jgi:hypothetical protein
MVTSACLFHPTRLLIKQLKPLFYKDSQKLARLMLYLLDNNNKHCTDNKNKTYRLQHNKNNTAEAQLTDSFGKELPLGLAPQPDREQQNCLEADPVLAGSQHDHGSVSIQNNPFAIDS